MAPSAPPEPEGPRYFAVGCLMVGAGFFSGGMIGVLVGKVVGMARRCMPAEGLPACEWHLYMFVGGIVGAISLPALTLWRLRKRVAAPTDQDRG